jgi:hypothetical protein
MHRTPPLARRWDDDPGTDPGGGERRDYADGPEQTMFTPAWVERNYGEDVLERNELAGSRSA